MMLRRIARPLLFIGLAVLGVLSPISRADAPGNSVLEQVNALRAAAGMTPLQHSGKLSEAATNHALYLSELSAQFVRPLQSAHEESPGYPGFTGHTPPDRAAHVGYPHKYVVENVSEGNLNLADSLTGLMSGIYHRFAFLDFLIDQIGSGIAYHHYVYMMGRSDLSAVCQNRESKAEMQTGVECAGATVKRSWFRELCGHLPTRALYTPPYPERCPNGELLDNAYMQKICADPPPGSEYQGKGKYYSLCGNRIRVKAKWFEKLCATNGPARFPGNGKFYRPCDGSDVAIHADWLDKQCRNAPTDALYRDSGAYYLPCNSDFQVRKEFSDELDHRHYTISPEFVLWPPDRWQHTPTMFFGEIPNPMPNLDHPGYPISIQFNPGKTGKVRVKAATLTDLSLSPAARLPLQRLDKTSDLNGDLTEWQFAWFPLQFLQSGHRYKMRVDAVIDGTPKTIVWQFKTSTP